MKGHVLPNYRIAVVGAGAVGSYYGGRRAEHGRDVHLLLRSDFEHVRKRGLRVTSKHGNFHLQGVNAFRESADIGTVDLVLIALKTTSNEALLEILPPLLHERTALLTLQNGLGSDRFLAEHFGAQRVMGGLCFVCINRTAPGVIEHSASGQIALGEYEGYLQPRTHEITSEFKRCGVTCTIEKSLAAAQWRKLVWNIPFNGLSIAAGGIDTEQILASDDLSYLVKQLMREIIAAAGMLGHEIPVSLIETMMANTKAMNAYRPSSLIDFQEGREVEVETIWGEPVRRAFNAGAEVGRMESLYRTVRHLVATR